MLAKGPSPAVVGSAECRYIEATQLKKNADGFPVEHFHGGFHVLVCVSVFAVTHWVNDMQSVNFSSLLFMAQPEVWSLPARSLFSV